MNQPEKLRILIIDDRLDLYRLCSRILSEEFAFHRVESGREAQSHLAQEGEPAAVLLDRDFSKADPDALLAGPGEARNEGIHILRMLKKQHPTVPVLMVSGFRERTPALEAAELGTDMLAWQEVIEDPEILRARLLRALERREEGVEQILNQFRELGVIVGSPSLSAALVALHRAARSGSPLLLLGETGTGKDTLAFAVHALAGDITRPFVSVNLAALNPNLIESELFGHARGAFTGADRPTTGKIRAADGGTLFLNEITELSRGLQAKLLSAIESREVVPVGDLASYRSSFRLISATSVAIREEVETGSFRRDLYHRIAWHSIEIPPLRERVEEIPALVRSFLRPAGEGAQNLVTGIARDALDYICELRWEGNIRELRGIVEASASIARYVITLADVREVLRRGEAPRALPRPGEASPEPVRTARRTESSLFDSLTYRELTARYFHHLHRATGGRMLEVARRAGIAKATAYEWRERYGPPEEEEPLADGR